MIYNDNDCRYMRRALQLAKAGRGHVSPNPMVGAVIAAPDGRIIGEGWHRHYGGPHAEVNAIRSVKEDDRKLLSQSTIYVTLEPCSHYGKTPPCAKLLVDTGIKRVVIGAGDPNPKVAGRGIAMLREAGIEVDTGLLAEESCRLNKTFMTAHTLRRPFVTLKWAQSADGFMDHRRTPDAPAARFSTPLTSLIVHDRRATHDAIAVGARTAILDHPRLDTRLVAGKSPVRIIFDRHHLADDIDGLHITADRPLHDTLQWLYTDNNITSLLVEGGPSLLSTFLTSGTWDEAYIEVSDMVLGDCGQAPAPAIDKTPVGMRGVGQNCIIKYANNPFC